MLLRRKCPGPTGTGRDSKKAVGRGRKGHSDTEEKFLYEGDDVPENLRRNVPALRGTESQYCPPIGKIRRNHFEPVRTDSQSGSLLPETQYSMGFRSSRI